MKPYSQRDESLKGVVFSPAKLKLSSYGCFIVSLSMLTEEPPLVTLEALEKNKCFNSSGMLLSDRATIALELNYKGNTTDIAKAKKLMNGNEWCVCETNHYKKSGYPQHFFVYNLNSGQAVDPLDGLEKLNPYKIISYRLFLKRNWSKELFPAKPPEADKTPTAAAEERYSELVERDIKASLAASGTPWKRFWERARVAFLSWIGKMAILGEKQ